MTDPLDPVLRTRLDRLARAVPIGPERLLRPIASVAPRYRGRSSLGVLAAAGLILVLVLAAVSMGGGANSTENMGSTTDGMFRLSIRAPKGHYASQEPVQTVATLEYVGADPSVEVYSTPGMPGFGVEQLDGIHRAGPGYRSSCVSYSFVRGQPVSYPFVKSGGLFPQMPDADFMERYLNIVDGTPDPVLHLPAGTWRIFAEAEFAEGGCGGTAHKLEVGITIVVAGPDPSSAAPVVQLATWPEPPPASGLCPAALMGGVTLRGDPASQSRPVWVESRGGLQRLVVWPYGFSARFSPDLELLNAQGDVVAREGDVLDLGGGAVASLDPGFDWYACHVKVASTSPEGVWGPLAVIPPQDGTDLARNEGTLRITDTCVYLESAGELTLLTWPADRTTWSGESRTITFENFDGSIVSVGDVEHVVLGGGGDSEAESGISGEEWVRRMEWVAPPAPSCSLDPRFGVGIVGDD
jgi:hypothetical protein